MPETKVEPSGRAEVSVCLSRERQEATTSSGAWALLGPSGRPHRGLESVTYILSQINCRFGLQQQQELALTKHTLLSPGTALWVWNNFFFFFALSKVMFWPPNTSQWGQIEIQQIYAVSQASILSSVLRCRKQQQAGQLGNNCAGGGPRLPSVTMVRIISQLWGWLELSSFPFVSTEAHLLLGTLALLLTSCHHQQLKP